MFEVVWTYLRNHYTPSNWVEIDGITSTQVATLDTWNTPEANALDKQRHINLQQDSIVRYVNDLNF